MSAKKLIETATAKGYSIGRLSPGNYYVSWEGYGEAKFAGAWNEFVKYVQGLPNRRVAC